MGVLFVVADFYIASRSFHVGRNIRLVSSVSSLPTCCCRQVPTRFAATFYGWVESVCAWQATPGSVAASTSSVFPINFLQCSVPTQATHFT